MTVRQCNNCKKSLLNLTRENSELLRRKKRMNKYFAITSKCYCSPECRKEYREKLLKDINTVTN